MKLGSYTYKKIAREALRGNWVRAAAAGIVAGFLGAFPLSVPSVLGCLAAMAAAIYFLEGIPGFFLVLGGCMSVIGLFYFFIGGVIRMGYIDFNLALLDRRNARLSLLLEKGELWWNVLCAKVIIFMIKCVGYVLLIVPGVILSYMYAMVPYILEERPDFAVHEAFEASRQIMKGHKWELFCLQISFLGWYILGIISFGIGLIFVKPYRQASEAAFYNEISGRADLFYGRNRSAESSDRMNGMAEE